MPPRRSLRSTKKPHTSPEAEQDNESHTTERVGSPFSPSVNKVSFQTLPDDINLEALAGLIPQTTSFETPNADTILLCYRALLRQQETIEERDRQVEDLYGQISRKDVEVDQLLQDQESTTRTLESSLEEAQRALKQVTEEKDEELTARQALEARLADLNVTQSSSSYELVSLRQKNEDVEREKRDLLRLIDRLKTEAAQREEELTELRKTLKEERNEHHELEGNYRSLQSLETATQFKLETLTQKLQLATGESERTNAELSTKLQEFSTYRRDKHAELVKLQASCDELTQTHNQTINTLRTLQSSHTSQNHQLSQALQKVQDLTGQIADQEAKYSSEAANLRRLVQMMEDRETQMKTYVEGIEKEWSELEGKAAAREGELRKALEEEQEKAEGLEKQLDNLQVVMDKINKGELPLPSRGDAPGTPSRQAGEIAGLAGFSPGLAMLSRMQKSGKTFTEVYADYVKLQEEFTKKNIECDRVNRTLAEVMAQIEERAPAFNQVKTEYERLQVESMQLATQLTQAIADKDTQAHSIQELTEKLLRTEKENGLLQHQLNDLGRQVQSLLRELGCRDDPSIPADEDMEGVTTADTIDDVITNNLVLFKSIPQLQEQNQKLLKITRDLGAKMEAEEKEYKETLDREQQEAIREAHQAIQTLQSQLENQRTSQQATIQAYIKERDTLKTMLSRFERQAAAGGVPQINGHASGSATSQEATEIQKEFETYKFEMSVDANRYKDDLQKYQREASTLGAALAKANAKIEFLNERHRMVTDQYNVRSREYDDLLKRNQQLYDQYTRADIACSHATEELTATSGQVERLRAECFNLRAEKQIWESIQTRLTEENKDLANERSRLSSLLTNLQKLNNSLVGSNDNDRKRLESQVQSLEQQAQELRTQLSREHEAVRQVTLQKDIETSELRTKIERVTEDLSKTRESLASAETSQKHLQDRVDDLAKQAQTSAEKLSVYERRTTAPGIAAAAANDQSKEEQLEAELAELRGALKAAEFDLSTARSHVQQYQEISQASEAALATLSATHEEYKASAEAQIARHEARQKELEEHLATVMSELSQSNEKYNTLQKTLEDERSAFANDRKTLEDTIVEITNTQMSSQADRTSHEDEIRAQEQRAKAAEEKYSHEIVAHAESIKALEEARKELNGVRASVREKTTAAETAESKLKASEVSWKQQKESLDKEINDLNARIKDLSSQNNLLHQHLESVSSQAIRIRQAGEAPAGTSDGAASTEGGGRASDLHGVVAYLRREKEIVDLQLELSKQENARMKAQIDHLSQSLEETRLTLSAEREKAAELLQNPTQHAELVERINQLNILRESNATLRAESEAHMRKTRQLESSIAALNTEINPVKEELKVVKAEVEEKNRQLSRLEDENRQWKDRNQQLLTKYDRIDPNDVQALRDEIEDLQIDVRKLEEVKTTQEAELAAKAQSLEESNKAVSDLKARNEKIITDTRQRFGQVNAQMRELRSKVDGLTKERDQLKASSNAAASDTSVVDGLKAQIESLGKEKASLEEQLAARAALESKVAQLESELSALRAERDRLVAEKAATPTAPASTEASDGTVPASSAVQQELESKIVAVQKERDEAISRAKLAEERVQKVTNEARTARFQMDKAQIRIAEQEKWKAAEENRIATLTAEHKKEQESAINAALEKLRADLHSSSPNTEAIVSKHAEELKALEARLVAKHEAELKATLENGKKSAPPTDAGWAEKEKALIEEHKKDRAAAMEQGRKEVEVKLRLKDQMLGKSQAHVKQLEAQIKSWRESGIQLPEVPKPQTAASTSTVNVPPPANASNAATAPPTAAGVAQTTPGAGPSAALPRKPSLNAPTGGGVALGTSAGVGRGAARGVLRGRGGVPGRGAARGIAPGRGGAPIANAAQNAAAAAAAAATPTAPAGQANPNISIMGAAAKRTREDSGTPDSLAKRLKPAEATSKPPVALRRDRVLPAPPAQQPPQ